MKTALITGSAGLIGSEAVRYFAGKGFRVLGIDNDMRRYFFGEDASTKNVGETLKNEVDGYRQYEADIREAEGIEKVFEEFNKDIQLVVHTAAQPSHDWAAREPEVDFHINASGTLNLLEALRKHAPDAVFVFLSTNKVYGDTPNNLPLIETETRYDLPEDHKFFDGIDESMTIDQSTHSLFGVSKAAADLLVQEYGRYFGLKAVCLRGGCLTGPQHSGTMLHGFLSYLMKCCVAGEPYTVIGYKGKQVRDNIHSYDLITAINHVFQNPRPGSVYNIGGGRQNSCSVLEAIALCEEISGKKMRFKIDAKNRVGDHQWYISCLKKLKSDYPGWSQKYSLKETLVQIHDALSAKAS